jgi:hypothetical protein
LISEIKKNAFFFFLAKNIARIKPAVDTDGPARVPEDAAEHDSRAETDGHPVDQDFLL